LEVLEFQTWQCCLGNSFLGRSRQDFAAGTAFVVVVAVVVAAVQENEVLPPLPPLVAEAVVSVLQ
jgi:hypothetical protein